MLSKVRSASKPNSIAASKVKPSLGTTVLAAVISAGKSPRRTILPSCLVSLIPAFAAVVLTCVMNALTRCPGNWTALLSLSVSLAFSFGSLWGLEIASRFESTFCSKSVP